LRGSLELVADAPEGERQAGNEDAERGHAPVPRVDFAAEGGGEWPDEGRGDEGEQK
jgi:hypothetical protein